MPSTVIVNFLTTVHAKSAGMLMCFPDVCQTPAPPAPPIPIPYPNIAQSTDTDKGTKKVKADGEPVMTKASNFKMSAGDEAGSVGGLISGKIKGKGYPQLYSMDVKFEGDNVVRLTDIMCGNGASPGNTPPIPETQPPGAPPVPGKDADEKEDPKKPKVTKLEFDPKECCCGDVIKVKAETEDFKDNKQLQLRILVDHGEKPKSASRRKFLGLPDDPVVDKIIVTGSLLPQIKGDKGEAKWRVRRGPYRKTVKWKLETLGIGAPKKSDNELTIKTAAKAKEKIGPKQRLTPVYEKKKLAGVKTWVKTTRNYGWEMCYEIEIDVGVLIVTRKVDFNFKKGASASKKKKRKWKKEIERIWDKKYKIHRKDCNRGDSCNCSPNHGCCQWAIRVICDWGSGHGKKVDLYKGANSTKCPDCNATGQAKGAQCGTCKGSGKAWGTPYWWYSHTWWEKAAGVPRTVRPHEFGHIIGMYDEYPAGACDQARLYTQTDSVMGSGSKVYQRFYKEFQDWFDKKSKSTVGATKLLRL